MQLQSHKHNSRRKSLPKRQMLLLEKLFCSHGVWSALPPKGKEEGARAVGSGTACAKGKKKRTEGNQLYFSSLIKLARGFACSSVMFSTNTDVEQRTAADQS